MINYKDIIEKYFHYRQRKVEKAMEILSEMENQEKIKYYLDITTIETLDDVKMILSGLDLAIYNTDPNFTKFEKYFTIKDDQ